MREKSVLGIRESDVQELKSKAKKCYDCTNTYCGSCREFVSKSLIYELVCDFERFWNEVDYLKGVNEDLNNELKDLNNQIYEMEKEICSLENELAEFEE